MTEISAALVKELRDATGAGMMDCKRTLVETGGDLDAAKRVLREKGLASAGKRAGRETTEGRVLGRVEDGSATLVGVGCETEPVSKNGEFVAFAEKALDTVAADGESAAATLEDERVELVAKLGENISVVDSIRVERQDGDVVSVYIHPPAQKTGVLVQLRGGDEETAKTLAQHISWSKPRWLTRDDVPAEELESERSIVENSDELKGKPEQARDKIIEGILKKRFFGADGGVLVDQPLIQDTSKPVAQVLSEAGAEVVAFKRIALGD